MYEKVKLDALRWNNPCARARQILGNSDPRMIPVFLRRIPPEGKWDG